MDAGPRSTYTPLTAESPVNPDPVTTNEWATETSMPVLGEMVTVGASTAEAAGAAAREPVNATMSASAAAAHFLGCADAVGVVTGCSPSGSGSMNRSRRT